MLATGTRSRAEATRRFLKIPGFAYHKSQWMETGVDPTLSPTVFLIEQGEDTELAAHFHEQNQYQVFVEGSGRIGIHEIAPITVHYAGAYTGYGPLVAGPEGLKYFTLRPVFENGGIPVSEARERMKRGPRRGAAVGPVKVPHVEDLKSLTHATHNDLIVLAEDGLAVRLTALPPHTALDPIAGGVSQGRFVFVAQGGLKHAGAGLTLWESLYLTADEVGPELISGEDGAAVLTLLVPPKSRRYLETEPS